jgi:hypothetical protein
MFGHRGGGEVNLQIGKNQLCRVATVLHFPDRSTVPVWNSHSRSFHWDKRYKIERMYTKKTATAGPVQRAKLETLPSLEVPLVEGFIP